MPLIPNYISRLRTHSQSTAASSSSNSASRSNSTAGPSTPGSELTRLAPDPLRSQPEERNDQTPVIVGRKIHPNLNALLDENVSPQDAVDDLGPRPPRGHTRPAEQPVITRPQDEQEPESVVASSSVISSRSPFMSRILSVPLLSSVMSSSQSDVNNGINSGMPHWSTFGRNRPIVSGIGEFGALQRRGSGSRSPAQSRSSRRHPQRKSPTATPSTTRPPSTSAPTTSSPPAQPAEMLSSQSNSPAGTVSSSSPSHSHSMRSHSLRSRRPPLVHPEPIPDAEPAVHLNPQTEPFHASSSTPSSDITSPHVANATLDDSPNTFGRTTPKGGILRAKSYPLFARAFDSSEETPSKPSKVRPHNGQPATFPRRKRTRSRPGVTSLVNFPSLLSKASASSLHQADEPAMADRRWSASWSAAEAIKSSDENQYETWPAVVSREMVRLSLHAPKISVGGEETSGVGHLGTLAEGSFKNPMLFGSIGNDRRVFMRAERRRTATHSGTPIQSPSTPQNSRPTSSFSASDSVAEGRTQRRSLAPQLSVTAPTPTPSPSGSRFGTVSDPASHSRSNNQSPTPVKRKIADDDDDEHARLSKRSLLSGSRDSSNRASETSQAPSSFRQPKRIRLSPPSHSPEHLSRSQSQSSRISLPRSRPPSSLRTLPPNTRVSSQASIPLSAIVSPHPPSIERRSVYRMRDPALPPSRRESTQWTGSARRSEVVGHRAFPLQGWAFMLGFLLFPVWWVAAVVPVGWGWHWHARRHQDGKGRWETDEEVTTREIWEYDVAFAWRRRCRLMSLFGLLVYLPLIVLLAVLIPRS